MKDQVALGIALSPKSHAHNTPFVNIFSQGEENVIRLFHLSNAQVRGWFQKHTTFSI